MHSESEAPYYRVKNIKEMAKPVLKHTALIKQTFYWEKQMRDPLWMSYWI